MNGPASRLERSTTVLLIVDLQERLAAVMSRREVAVARTLLLAEAAAIVGCPIIATRQYPQGLGDVVGSLAEALGRLESQGAHVIRVDKLAFDCFAEPEFVEAFDSTGKKQVLISGMESHICVTQTALAALGADLDVHVAADACCSREAETHEVAMMRMSRAGIVITTAESAAYELVGRAGTPEFKALLRAVKG